MKLYSYLTTNVAFVLALLLWKGYDNIVGQVVFLTMFWFTVGGCLTLFIPDVRNRAYSLSPILLTTWFTTMDVCFDVGISLALGLLGHPVLGLFYLGHQCVLLWAKHRYEKDHA